MGVKRSLSNRRVAQRVEEEEQEREVEIRIQIFNLRRSGVVRLFGKKGRSGDRQKQRLLPLGRFSLLLDASVLSALIH
jgi:hypothetical protein